MSEVTTINLTFWNTQNYKYPGFGQTSQVSDGLGGTIGVTYNQIDYDDRAWKRKPDGDTPVTDDRFLSGEIDDKFGLAGKLNSITSIMPPLRTKGTENNYSVTLDFSNYKASVANSSATDGATSGDTYLAISRFFNGSRFGYTTIKVTAKTLDGSALNLAEWKLFNSGALPNLGWMGGHNARIFLDAATQTISGKNAQGKQEFCPTPPEPGSSFGSDTGLGLLQLPSSQRYTSITLTFKQQHIGGGTPNDLHDIYIASNTSSTGPAIVEPPIVDPVPQPIPEPVPVVPPVPQPAPNPSGCLPPQPVPEPQPVPVPQPTPAPQPQPTAVTYYVLLQPIVVPTPSWFGQPGMVIPGQPGSVIPGQPPFVIPGQPGSVIPGQPPFVIPGQPGAVIPGQPGSVIPGQPPFVIPGQPGAVIPGQPPFVIPGQPGAVIPGQPGAVIPGQGPTVIPGQPGAVIPGQPPTVIPGQPGAVIPGQPPTVIPGRPGAVIPGQSPTVIPGQAPTVIPGQSPTVIPGQPGAFIPGQSPTVIPGQPGAVIPGRPGMVIPGQYTNGGFSIPEGAIVPASATVLSISSVGIWSSVIGGETATGNFFLNGVGTNQISWGMPYYQGFQSAYRFDGVSSVVVALDGSAFTLGSFTHFNYPIAGDSITSATLVFTLNINGVNTEFNFTFRHVETANQGVNGTCPVTPGMMPPCPDVVLVENVQSQETVVINGKQYALNIIGFWQNNQLVTQMITFENQLNTAQLFAQWVEIPVEQAPQPVNNLKPFNNYVLS